MCSTLTQDRVRKQIQEIVLDYRHLDMNNNWGCIRGAPMGKLKKAPLVIGGTVAGIVAIRSVRRRRSKSSEDEPREEKPQGPETATEHAKVAVEHTRQAAEKTKKSLPRTSKGR